MAKVVLVDNLNRDEIEDKLYVENVSNEEAERIANEYNRKNGPFWDRCARAVEDGYELCRGMEDFV